MSRASKHHDLPILLAHAFVQHPKGRDFCCYTHPESTGGRRYCGGKSVDHWNPTFEVGVLGPDGPAAPSSDYEMGALAQAARNYINSLSLVDRRILNRLAAKALGCQIMPDCEPIAGTKSGRVKASGPNRGLWCSAHGVPWPCRVAKADSSVSK